PANAAPVVGLRRSVSASIIAVLNLLLHPAAQSGVMSLDEDVAGSRIGRSATPIRTAVSRKLESASRRGACFMEKEWSERPGIVVAASFLPKVLAGFRVLGRCVVGADQIFFFKAGARQRRRFQREGLCGRIPFSGHVAFGDRALLHAEYRF